MNDQATDLAFAPDGRTLAAGGRTEGTFVWTVHDSAARTQLSGFDSPPSSLAFSEDGVLAGGGWRGNVWFWRNGRCPELGPPLPQPAAYSSSPSPGGADPRRPESPAREGARKGERDRARDGNRPMMREMVTPPVLAFDSESRLVAHDAQGLRIWPAGSISAQTPPVFIPALSGFDLRLMSSESEVGRLSTSGQNLVVVADLKGVLHFHIFDGDGKVVVDTDATSLPAKAGPIADLKKQLDSLRPPHRLTRSEKDRGIAAVTSIVGHTLLPRITGTGWRMTPMAKTSDGRNLVLVRSSAVFLWNAESPDRVTPVTPPPGWGTVPASVANKASRPVGTAGAEWVPPSFRAVQIAPGGDRIYLLEQNQGQGNPLHVWALARPFESSPRQAHDLNWGSPLTDGAISIALRRDGDLLAVGDRTGTVTLIDTRTRALVEKIHSPASGDSENFWLTMAFSPDGQNLAIGSSEGTISLWSVAQPKRPRPRFHLPGHRGTTTNLVFDTQGRRLASAGGTDPLVEVWDLDLIGRELTRLGLAD